LLAVQRSISQLLRYLANFFVPMPEYPPVS
jgi:hypothetical protein